MPNCESHERSARRLQVREEVAGAEFEGSCVEFPV